MVNINVLINYINRVLGFSAKEFKNILDGRSISYTLEHKGVNLFVIRDVITDKIKPLPCISKVYTSNPNGKALKMANNNSKCYMASRALDITAQFNDCRTCHQQCIEHYNTKNIFLVKK